MEKWSKHHKNEGFRTFFWYFRYNFFLFQFQSTKKHVWFKIDIAICPRNVCSCTILFSELLVANKFRTHCLTFETNFKGRRLRAPRVICLIRARLSQQSWGDQPFTNNRISILQTDNDAKYNNRLLINNELTHNKRYYRKTSNSVIVNRDSVLFR